MPHPGHFLTTASNDSAMTASITQYFRPLVEGMVNISDCRAIEMRNFVLLVFFCYALSRCARALGDGGTLVEIADTGPGLALRLRLSRSGLSSRPSCRAWASGSRSEAPQPDLGGSQPRQRHDVLPHLP